MKKLFMTLIAFAMSLAIVQGANAKTVQVIALDDFNTANPPQVIHVQMNANTRLAYDLMLFQGFQVTGRVVPQANGGFLFVPISYVNYHEESLPIEREFPAAYKGYTGLIRQNQPFLLVFPDKDGTESFQYYVPSVSDMN